MRQESNLQEQSEGTPIINGTPCWAFFFFFYFLWPHLQLMEVPKLGVESKLQLLAYTTATATRESETLLRPTPQFRAMLDP